MNLRRRTAAAAVGLLLAASAAGAQELYSVIDLGDLGGDRIEVRGINDAGKVVGASEYTGGGVDTHAFLWLPAPEGGMGAGMNDLGTLGGPASRARDVDPFGRVVGDAELDDPVDPPGRAFLWEAGTMTDLGTLPPWPHSGAEAINRHGDVVGTAASFGCEPVLWLPEPRYGLPAGINGLPLLPGFNDGQAQDINDHGEVVGRLAQVCDLTLLDHGYLWLPAPAYGLPAGPNDITPDLPQGWFATAEAINDLGEVVGSQLDLSTGDSEPFLWRDGSREVLPLPPGLVSGRALEINDLGQAVGTGDDGVLPPNEVRLALLWSDGEVIDLNTLIPPDSGWHLHTATAINDRGQIVGHGILDGARRAFLLSPPGAQAEIPTLGTAGAALLVLLLAAAGALLLVRRG